MNIIVRQENAADWRQIRTILTSAFETNAEAKLVEDLRKTAQFVPELALVASVNGEVCGHILFTKVQIITESNSSESLALAPMAVLPSMQQHGIGKQLVKIGLNRAKAIGFGSVIVLGHPDYYPKFGFLPASKYSIYSPWKVPDHVFMALELQRGSLSNVQGVVNYAAPFMEL
ncbi:MAG: N-acetyltransferase [Bacteroidales bacterium]|nr:N-acetyltransferase [Bacteroidales bacterium]